MSEENVAPAAPIQEAAPEAEASPEIAAAPAPAETKAEAIKAAAKRLSVNINGKNEEFDFDPNNEDFVKTLYSKSKGADRAFQEAAEMRKQTESLVKDLMADPKKFLSNPHLGIDLKQMAVEILTKELEEAEMDPKEKALRDMELKLKSYEEEKKQLEKQKLESDKQRIEHEALEQFDNEITEALKTSSTLPKSPYVVDRIGKIYMEALMMKNDDGSPMFPNVSVKDVMPYVQQQISEELRNLVGAAPDEVVEMLLGKDRLNNMRKARVAAAKAPVAPKIQETGKSNKPKDEGKKEAKKTWAELYGKWTVLLFLFTFLRP